MRFLKSLLRVSRSVARQSVWKNPRIYRALGLAKKRYLKEFDEPQDFFVFGFPRSSNTYCGYYLKLNLRSQLRLLFQLHLPPMVIEVLNRGIPHMLVIRNPKDCAKSYAIMCGSPVLDQLDYYIDFHSCLLRYRECLFIVPFEDSTKRIRDVFKELETRFSIDLECAYSPAEAESRTRKAILEGATDRDGTVNHRHYHLPSDQRLTMARSLEAEFLLPEVAARLQTAENLYREFLKFRVPLPAIDPSAAVGSKESCNRPLKVEERIA